MDDLRSHSNELLAASRELRQQSNELRKHSEELLLSVRAEGTNNGAARRRFEKAMGRYPEKLSIAP